MDALQVTGLEKAFRGTPVVRGVSFDLAPGEIVGLIGINGAGKSTTLRTLVGQVVPDAGSIVIGGKAPREARTSVGYVAQDESLFPDLTGRENLEFLGRVRGLTNNALTTGIEAALSLADIGDAADRLVREYSGGMRQRVALAGAFLGNTTLVILDEALQGLDPGALLRFKERIAAFGDSGGATLLCSHNLDLLCRLCGRILLLEAGRVAREFRDEPVAELEACFHPSP